MTSTSEAVKSRILCRNVHEIRFGSPRTRQESITTQSGVPAYRQQSLQESSAIKTMPSFHPSVSWDNLSSPATDSISSKTFCTVNKNGVEKNGGNASMASISEHSEILQMRRAFQMIDEVSLDIRYDGISGAFCSGGESSARPPRLKQLKHINILLAQNAQRHLLGEDYVHYLYLISACWVRAWHQYVSHVDSDAIVYHEPGPIDNTVLISVDESIYLSRRFTSLEAGSCPACCGESSGSSGGCYLHSKYRLREGIKEGAAMEYLLVPIEAWDAFCGWYGLKMTTLRAIKAESQYANGDIVIRGPPLPRSIFNSTRFRTAADIFSNDSVTLLGGLLSSTSVSPVRLQEQDLYPGDEVLPCVLDVQEAISKRLSNATGTNSGSSSTTGEDGELTTSSGADETILLTTAGGDRTRVETVEKCSPQLLLQRCFVCQRLASQRCSKCACIYYCSRECQLIHWKYHKQVCSKIHASSSALTEGKVGLLNLGNSCYMNSSLQCLSHVKPLTLALLSHSALRDDLNRDSRDGTGGVLAEQYAKLLQDLWFSNNGKTISPHIFKAMLGRLNPEQYAGLAQQDAHELIEFLLDKLHEDLNRVKKKPYTEKVEGDGSNDAEVGRESWRRLGLREDSIVRDTFGGLMRSQLTCGCCGRVSVTYEYHTTLQIAIPRANTRTISIVFVPEVLSADDAACNIAGTNHATSRPVQPDPASNAVSILRFEIKIDRLANVRAVKDVVAQSIPAALLKRGGGDILLIEAAIAEQANAATTSAAEGSDSFAISRVLRDQLPVSKLVDGCMIFAYCPPLHLSNRLLLLPRTLSPTISGSACLSEEDSPSSKIQFPALASAHHNSQNSRYNLLQGKLTGVPILVSYDPSWSCLRVRYQIWLNVVGLKLNSVQSLAHKRAVRALVSSAGGSLPGQFKESSAMRIRLVDFRGNGKLVAALKETTKSTAVPSVALSTSESLRSLFDELGAAIADVSVRQIWLNQCASVLSPTHQHRDGSTVDEIFGSPIPTDKSLLFDLFVGARKPVAARGSSSDSSATNPLVFISWDIIDSASSTSPVNNSLFERLLASTSHNDSCSEGCGVSLQRCLGEHTKEEILDKGNEVYCSSCKSHKSARKIVTFCKEFLPQVLILTLKRFEFRNIGDLSSSHRGMTGAGALDNLMMLGATSRGAAAAAAGMHREKIDTFVDFPIDGLDLEPFCHRDDSISDSSHGDRTSSLKEPLYDLFAVCNHYGRMGFGHYTAAARDWLPKEEQSKMHCDASSHPPLSDTNYFALSSEWCSFDDGDLSTYDSATRTGIRQQRLKNSSSILPSKKVAVPTNESFIDEEVRNRSAYILFYRRRL